MNAYGMVYVIASYAGITQAQHCHLSQHDVESTKFKIGGNFAIKLSTGFRKKYITECSIQGNVTPHWCM